ncbi:chorion class B protein PC10-like isoform X4 [Maniola jurtina]|uniref:chorion class B protein PC10-like isoform X4 n=1 Tax=Maniola jurtina TaxID=191418 RepID=UPI001E6871E2|nr:chorion class B protein PC10-like isoform X4 [Maniola jurtina]
MIMIRISFFFCIKGNNLVIEPFSSLHSKNKQSKMVFKAVLFVCAQALVMQSIAGQCIGAGWAGAPWGGCGAPCGGIYGAELVATPAFSGGALPVASASAIPPNGVSVLSENAYAGELAVRGALPFLGTAALEGVLPTAGAGAVAYGCGNGEVAMLTEGIGAAGIAGPLGYGAALGPLGYGYGYDGLARGGCGYGRAFI